MLGVPNMEVGWMLALAFGAGDCHYTNICPFQVVGTCRQNFSVASVFIWRSRPRLQRPDIPIRIIVEIHSIFALLKHPCLICFVYLQQKRSSKGTSVLLPVAYISIFLMSRLGAGKFAQEAVRGERDCGNLR